MRDVNALYDIVETLVELSEARQDATPAQLALAWLLSRPSVSSLVIGARTEAQLEDNLKAALIRLTAEEAAKLEAISRPPLLYPYWHQKSSASDRLSPADLALIGSHLS